TFGLHTLMARNLVEHGAPFVMVANGMPWDNHVFQHEIHQMLVPELDRILHCLITDLDDCGLLDHTLVVAMGEFGRTPWLNGALGVAATPDAFRLFAACMDGAVYAVDPAQGGVTPFAAKHDSFASGCVVLPGETTLISAGYDGWLFWHDVATKQCFRWVRAHD